MRGRGTNWRRDWRNYRWEIVINSIIETGIDKIAGGETADDNTAGERVEVLTGGRGLSGRRDWRDYRREIVINSITEIGIDKIAGEAANDNTAEELAVDPSIELAILEAAERVDEIFVDPSIEAILEAAELAVDPSIEAIQSRGTIDEEAEGPRFESSPQ